MRHLAKASSVFRRFAASSTTHHKLLNPAVFPAVAAVPYHTNLANHLSQTSTLFFPVLLVQFRGYAPGRGVPDRRVPKDDDDLSDDDMDSEDFEIGGDEDDDDGITDEDYLDEDEVEDESD